MELSCLASNNHKVVISLTNIMNEKQDLLLVGR